MSINPYESPATPGINPLGDRQSERAFAANKVSAPAQALMIVSGISIVLVGLAIPFDLFLLVSGAAQRLERAGIDPSIRIAIRLVWDLVIFAASCYVCWGAVQMKGLVNYSHARNAAIVACVPCVGPCCLIGIPFGIWALNVLGRSDVQNSFQS
jgi:hypothetical protein